MAQKVLQCVTLIYAHPGNDVHRQQYNSPAAVVRHSSQQSHDGLCLAHVAGCMVATHILHPCIYRGDGVNHTLTGLCTVVCIRSVTEHLSPRNAVTYNVRIILAATACVCRVGLYSGWV